MGGDLTLGVGLGDVRIVKASLRMESLLTIYSPLWYDKRKKGAIPVKQ